MINSVVLVSGVQQSDSVIYVCVHICTHMYTHPHGLPSWLSGKESACDAGDTGDPGLIPGSGRSPGGGRGNPLQYSCLENPMDQGDCQATAHRVIKSRT